MSGLSEKSIPSPEGTAVVLAVSPLPADRVRLREILSRENWKLHEASDCCEAVALLRDQSIPVLLCERDHADGNWEDLLKATARLPAPPNLIVFSRLADESLWVKVLNLGGFDVLMTPSSRRRSCESPSLPGVAGNATLVRAPLKKRLVLGTPRPSRRLRRKRISSMRRKTGHLPSSAG